MRQYKYLKEDIKLFEKLLNNFEEVKVVSCTFEEVQALELMLPQPYYLPTAYKEFLLYGGKNIKGLSDWNYPSYSKAKIDLETEYEEIFELLLGYNKNTRLPSDIFVINQWLSDYFIFFLLTEGKNPPIYYWKESLEKLSKSEKLFDSFSDYFREIIRTESIILTGEYFWNAIKTKNFPRNKQFWIPSLIEIKEGISRDNLMKYFRFDLSVLKEIAAILKLNPDSYLEEISGWKCHKVNENHGDILFLPIEIKE